MTWKSLYQTTNFYVYHRYGEVMVILVGYPVTVASPSNVANLATISGCPMPLIVSYSTTSSNNILAVGMSGELTLYTSDVSGYAAGNTFAALIYPCAK